MTLAPLPLSPAEISTLEAAASRGPHPRMRCRAQAVLGHHRGASIGQLARLFAVGYNTVSEWLRRWQNQGLLAGLAEGQRSGRPAKLPSAAKKSGNVAGCGHPAVAGVAAGYSPELGGTSVREHVASLGPASRRPLEAVPAPPVTPARPRRV